MHTRLILERSAPEAGCATPSREGGATFGEAGPEAFSREGRDSEACRLATRRVLFSRQGLVPGAWIVLLAATCTFVAVRALSLPLF